MFRASTFVVPCLAALALAIATCGCSGKGGTASPPAKAAPAIEQKPTTQEEPKVPAKPAPARPVVIIETSMGTIKAELWPDLAPETAANFLRYVDEKFYDGLIFHRVIPGFMIQGGGFMSDMREKPAGTAIRNEAAATLRNDRGTLAMARTNQVNSATSQFFINLVNNDALNHKDGTPQGFGYCAFGKVTEGMDVVDEIAKVQTGNRPPHQNVPVEPVVIKTIRKAG